MSTPAKTDRFAVLTVSWLSLVALTLLGLGLSEWFRSANWLPALVAAIIWLKGTLVAREFIGAHLAHPFIRRVVAAFVLIPPLALIFTAFFGATLARWASL